VPTTKNVPAAFAARESPVRLHAKATMHKASACTIW